MVGRGRSLGECNALVMGFPATQKPVGAVDQSEQLVSLTSNKAVPWLRKRECDTQGRLQPVEGSWEPLAFILKLFDKNT